MNDVFTVKFPVPERSVPQQDHNAVWDADEAENAKFKSLSRADAARLKARQPGLSPWRVVATQVVLGVVMALIGRLVTGKLEVMWSLLYGAATTVVPGALMARGMTSPLSSLTPGSSAVSVLLWSTVKIGVSVLMLVLAPRVVQPLNWPALLLALVVCMQVYWLALLWRKPGKAAQ